MLNIWGDPTPETQMTYIPSLLSKIWDLKQGKSGERSLKHRSRHSNNISTILTNLVPVFIHCHLFNRFYCYPTYPQSSNFVHSDSFTLIYIHCYPFCFVGINCNSFQSIAFIRPHSSHVWASVHNSFFSAKSILLFWIYFKKLPQITWTSPHSNPQSTWIYRIRYHTNIALISHEYQVNISQMLHWYQAWKSNNGNHMDLSRGNIHLICSQRFFSRPALTWLANLI